MRATGIDTMLSRGLLLLLVFLLAYATGCVNDNDGWNAEPTDSPQTASQEEQEGSLLSTPYEEALSGDENHSATPTSVGFPMIDPDKVLEQVFLFPSGGSPPVPQVLVAQHGDLMLTAPRKECLGLGIPAVLHAKSWAPEEQVQVKVTQPNGEVREYSESTFFGDSVEFRLITLPGDPVGMYTVEFEGSRGVIQGTVDVERRGPTLTRMNENLLLHGFAPYERIRLLTYEKAVYGELLEAKEYQVNPAGQLLVDPERGGYFVVIGDTSGEVNNSWGYSVFKGDIYARVLDHLDSPVRVRASPDFNSRVIEEVVGGDKMRVLDESRDACGARAKWVQVSLENSRAGWIVSTMVTIHGHEIGEGEHASCPSALPQRVKLGGRFVACAPSALVVRAGPGATYSTVTEIPPDTTLRVVYGPECVEGKTWWKIRSSLPYVEGWVPEGGHDVDSYFICPNP